MAAEQRREQLLDAALGVIVDQGYSRVSVEAVARAAGVTRPVVYDHFRDLGQLLQVLIEREERYSLEQLAHVLPDGPAELHPALVLAGSVRRFLDAVGNRPATWTLILLPLEGTPDIVRRHVEANRAKVLAHMESVVRWAADQLADEPRTQVSADIELAARAVLSFAEDAGRMVLTDRERYAPERYEQFARWLTQLLWPTDGAQAVRYGST